jgi:hypothetical protein
LLEEGEREQELMALRRVTCAGKPLGSKEFHARIEETNKKLKQDQEGPMERFDGGLATADKDYFVAV